MFKLLRSRFLGDALGYLLFNAILGTLFSFTTAIIVGMPMDLFIKYYTVSTVGWNLFHLSTGGLYGKFLDKWRILWNRLRDWRGSIGAEE